MSHGLRVYDGAGRLVFDSTIPAYSLCYVGQATYSADNGSFYTDYTISHPTRPLPFIVLPDDGVSVIGVKSVTDLGGGVWRIRLLDMKVGGAGRTRPAVYCFGRPVGGPLSTFGLRCYSASGVLDLDTTRGILNVSHITDYAGRNTSQVTQPVSQPLADLSGIANPAVYVAASGYSFTYTPQGMTGLGTERDRSFGASRSGNSVFEGWGLTLAVPNIPNGTFGQGTWVSSPQRVFVVNMNKYL